MADFWGIMEARGEGHIPNLDYLTMFADYRVPQGLVHLGALRYSDALMETLKKGLLHLFDKIDVKHYNLDLFCFVFLRDSNKKLENVLNRHKNTTIKIRLCFLNKICFNILM